MTPEMINALVELWKPLSVIFIFILLVLFLVLYRNPLSELIPNLKKLLIKTEKMEVSIEQKEKNTDYIATSSAGNSTEQQLENTSPQLLIDKTDPEFWLNAVIPALKDRKPEEAQVAFDNYKLSEIDTGKKLHSEVVYNYLKYVHMNDQLAINNIQKLTETESIRSFAFYWLSQCYLHVSSYEKAYEMLNNSLNSALTDGEMVNRAESLANLMLVMGYLPKDVLKMIQDIFKKVPSKEKQGPLYIALSDIFEKSNEPILKAVVLEKVIELSPDNQTQIFNAAFAQSQAGLSALSISNYDALLRQNPENALALNNLGYEFTLVDMPIRAVKYYKASAGKNETLAMANIAMNFITSGFIDEAEEIIKTAQKQNVVHTNIADAITTISKVVGEEDKKWDKFIQIGIKQKSFLQNLAEARFNSQAEVGIFGGFWNFNKEEIIMAEEDGKISVEWGSGPHKRKFAGELSGKSAKLTIYKWALASWASEKGYYDGGTPGFCYLTSDNQKMCIMGLYKNQPEFFEFEREN